MPEFIQEDLMPWKTIKVHFENIENIDAFAKLIDQNLTGNTQYVWYPEADKIKVVDKGYVDES